MATDHDDQPRGDFGGETWPDWWWAAANETADYVVYEPALAGLEDCGFNYSHELDMQAASGVHAGFADTPPSVSGNLWMVPGTYQEPHDGDGSA